jgi:hypothetical protein
MPWEGWDVGTNHETLGMYTEPDTPYVFAEWDFDLDMDHKENSTHQFRCVSVYGLTDNHNAVDPDMGSGTFLIDKEVVYQLEQIFNPFDLKDAAHKDTFRWAQKGTVPDGAVWIPLSSHECVSPDHSVWVPEKWGYYCNDSEKVLVWTAGSDQILLERDVDYDISPRVTGGIMITNAAYEGYFYKILYTTKYDGDIWHTGQWEWTILGEASLPSDSLGASMVSSAWGDWKNIEVWLSGLDYQSTEVAPSIPWVMRNFTATSNGRDAFYMDDPVDHERACFKDDWCTPDDWTGDEIHPYAVSSSNVIVVGGPINNLAAEYFNDFTDALIFTEYGDGFYGPGCWARTTQDHWEGNVFVNVTDDELWYNSDTTLDDVGHAIVSVYKDLNETVGFIVYGYTAEDTYYACYALRGGLLPWMQYLQDGTTTLVIEIDYTSLHPVKFHVKESLGRFTECTGFYTDFKTTQYYSNIGRVEWNVGNEADILGLCYKLIDIEWCAQVHPDP